MTRRTAQRRGGCRRRYRAYANVPYGSYGRRPLNSADAMDMHLQGFGQLLLLLLSLPFFIVFVAVDVYSRKARRRTYYAREREKRIQLADGRQVKLGDYAGIEELVEGPDGKFYVIDREEYARREAMARERRRIRKHYSLNAKPTAEALKAQWNKVRESPEDMLRFGSMLCDLEAYEDNSLRYNRYGEFCGRAPGIKGWLAVHCPEIHARYSTAMGYKQMAVKAKQAISMDEPYPLTVALGDDIPGIAGTASGSETSPSRTMDGTDALDGPESGMSACGSDSGSPVSGRGNGSGDGHDPAARSLVGTIPAGVAGTVERGGLVTDRTDGCWGACKADEGIGNGLIPASRSLVGTNSGDGAGIGELEGYTEGSEGEWILGVEGEWRRSFAVGPEKVKEWRKALEELLLGARQDEAARARRQGKHDEAEADLDGRAASNGELRDADRGGRGGACMLESALRADDGRVTDGGIALDNGRRTENGCGTDGGIALDNGRRTENGCVTDEGIALDNGRRAEDGCVTDGGSAADSGRRDVDGGGQGRGRVYAATLSRRIRARTESRLAIAPFAGAGDVLLA